MSAFGVCIFGRATIPIAKSNLKEGFLVLDISGTLFARAKAPGQSMLPRGRGARRSEGMAHVWNEPYRALYDRTYQVLFDAGIDEKLADELATQRTLAVALMSREQPFPDFVHRSVGPHHLRSFNTPTTQRDCS